jgi:GNAT superfamily N-acetyltransferase
MSGGWRVRAATHHDVPRVATAVRELLLELGGTPPSTPAMEAASLALLEDREAGALLVAEAEGGVPSGDPDRGVVARGPDRGVVDAGAGGASVVGETDRGVVARGPDRGVVDAGAGGASVVGETDRGVVARGPDRGVVDAGAGGKSIVGDPDRELIGVLGASWQTAIHVPGRYALIQDLWVHPSWRGRAIGSDLLAALFELARQRQITRAEVGLPSERYERLGATEAFYLDNGFAPLGPRMRRALP